MKRRIVHRRSGSRTRRLTVLAAIVLWLTSSVAAAACCCQELGLAIDGSPSVAKAGDQHGDVGGHGHAHHAADSAGTGPSHGNAPADDCEQVTSSHLPLVPKAGVPPSRAGLEVVALPAPLPLHDLWSASPVLGPNWFPPPSLRVHLDPFLSTVRLLL